MNRIPCSELQSRMQCLYFSIKSFPLLLSGLLIATILAGCTGTIGAPPTELSGSIKISGSTALQPLVVEAAKMYMKVHPKTHINVQGGGSKTGLTDVTSGKVNIGDSDLYADPAIYPDPNLTDHIVCVSPFSMIVNPDVSVNSLTQDQIIKIFSSNEINNWNKVGGSDLAIKPVVRPTTSGTRDTFRKYILGGRDENGVLLKQDSSTLVRDTIAQTPGAIGYLAVAVINSSVHDIAIDGNRPTQDNITSGKYTFWAYEHMYTLGDNNPLLTSFLDFMQGKDVQNKAKELHYIPIAVMNLPKVANIGPAGGDQSHGSLPLAFTQKNEGIRRAAH